MSSGLERDKFDNKTVSFEEHIKLEHNMWNYLYFIVLVRVKNKTDYTGPESYVAQMIKVRALGVAVAPAPAAEACGGGADSCGHLLKGQQGAEQLQAALGRPRSPAGCLCSDGPAGLCCRGEATASLAAPEDACDVPGPGARCCGSVAGQTLPCLLLWTIRGNICIAFWVKGGPQLHPMW